MGLIFVNAISGQKLCTATFNDIELLRENLKKNKMVKVEAPVVPNVRASSFDSVDSIRFEH